MNEYSGIGLKRLAELHPDLQKICNRVLPLFDNTILCGYRGEAEQNKAYNSGNSKLKYPQSKHNSKPSMAVDMLPFPIDWKDINRMRYFAGFVVGIGLDMYERGEIEHKVRWGGDWDQDTEVKDNTFNDMGHFELIK